MRGIGKERDNFECWSRAGSAVMLKREVIKDLEMTVTLWDFSVESQVCCNRYKCSHGTRFYISFELCKSAIYTKCAWHEANESPKSEGNVFAHEGVPRRQYSEMSCQT